MFAVMDAQTLVLPAYENGTYYVADDEEGEENVVETVVVDGVEDGEEDEAYAASDGCDDGYEGVEFLPYGGVGGKASGVAEPALGDEGDVEGYGCCGGHGDEEGS